MTATGSLVPVSVIGGYLGAGKTTMINHLLRQPHGRRLAVLVNDFGAVNVDADLIASHDGDTISLENGCVCCSIGDALGDAIDRVLAMDKPPDQIVIEASGVADPAKVAIYGQGWPGCRLDAVVVAVDVETIRDRAVDRFVGSTVMRQLRSADLIVMTKTDLVEAAERERVEAWLASTTPGRPLLTANAGAIEPDVVLDVDAAHGAGPQPSGLGAGAVIDGGAATARDAGEVFESVHLDVGSLAYRLDRSRLEQALATWPREVVRVKGMVQLETTEAEQASDGEAGCHLVQRVGARWSIERSDGDASGLVVIGLKGRFDAAALLETLS